VRRHRHMHQPYSLRQECLDHVLVVNEQHLQAVLREYVGYYNTERPHRSLTLLPPRPSARTPQDPGARPGRVIVRPILGGLHHVCERAA
jgi:putative transposase